MSFSTSDKAVSFELWEQKLEYNKIEFALWQLSESFEIKVKQDTETIINKRTNGVPYKVSYVNGQPVNDICPYSWESLEYVRKTIKETGAVVNGLFAKYGINLTPNWTEINKHWLSSVERLEKTFGDALGKATQAALNNQAYKYQQAYDEELSKDFGLSFGILSSSLVNHLIYAAQSAAKEKKDHERAERVANEAMSNSHVDITVRIFSSVYPIYVDSLEPAMQKLLGEYYAYIVSLFSKELGYNYDDIAERFNLDKSFDILDNGEISKETLISALEKNPNNGVIIGYAIQYGYLDTELCAFGHNSSPMFLNRLKNWAIARLSEIYKAGKLFNKPLINDENRIIINGLKTFYSYKQPRLEKCQDWQDILMGAFTQDVAKHLTEMGEIAVAKSNMLIPAEFDKLAKSGKKFYLDSESKSLFVCLYHELYFNGAYTSASFLDLKAPFTVEDIDNSLKDINEKITARLDEINRQAEERRKQEEARKEAFRIAEIERKEKIKKTTKKLAAIITPIIAVFLVFVILLTTVIIPTNKYNQALTSIENKNYSKAIDLFSELGDYKDSKKQIEKILTDNPVYKFYKANIGDIITLGNYEQDANLQNGKEIIEWKIITIKNNRVLLLSKYCIEYLQYHSEDIAMTWEQSDLRDWLNNNFYNQSFSNNEKSLILEVLNETPDYNDLRFVEGGNNTYDKVFLLSAKEVNQYTTKNERKTVATPYVKQKGIYVRDNDGNSPWCLRSPGAFENYVAYVNWTGDINYAPNFVYHYQGVRPAVWIDISSIN